MMPGTSPSPAAATRDEGAAPQPVPSSTPTMGCRDVTQPDEPIPLAPGPDDPPTIVERYQVGSVAQNEELFAADAQAKALRGYKVIDVHTEGKALVVAYRLATTGPRA